MVNIQNGIIINYACVYQVLWPLSRHCNASYIYIVSRRWANDFVCCRFPCAHTCAPHSHRLCEHEDRRSSISIAGDAFKTGRREEKKNILTFLFARTQQTDTHTRERTRSYMNDSILEISLLKNAEPRNEMEKSQRTRTRTHTHTRANACLFPDYISSHTGSPSVSRSSRKNRRNKRRPINRVNAIE